MKPTSVDPRAFRHRRNFLIAKASEASAPILRASANVATRGIASPPTEWRSGLILGHTHIGDVMYRTCSLDRLATALPDCRWSYAVSRESADVLKNNPAVAEILTVIEGENSWQLNRGGFTKLKSRRFDAVLCTNTLRHYPDLVLAAAIGIPNRVAFVGKGFSGLVTLPVGLEFPQPYPGYFRRMVATVTDTPGDDSLRPRIYPTELERRSASEVRSGLGFDESLPLLACTLRTRQSHGNWPVEVIVDIIEMAYRIRPFNIVLCGGSADAQYLSDIGARLSMSVSIVARASGLLDFAAFLEQCNCLLAIDSGPRHIGNAAGVPVVFARNLSHSKIEAGKYCDGETDLAPDVEYLSDEATDRIVRSLSIEKLAATLVNAFRP